MPEASVPHSPEQSNARCLLKKPTVDNQIGQDILNELRLQSRNEGLWDADDIAHYKNLSKSTIQCRVICKQSFPRALWLPTTETGGGRRWVAKEIKQWVMRHREPCD